LFLARQFILSSCNFRSTWFTSTESIAFGKFEPAYYLGEFPDVFPRIPSLNFQPEQFETRRQNVETPWKLADGAESEVFHASGRTRVSEILGI